MKLGWNELLIVGVSLEAYALRGRAELALGQVGAARASLRQAREAAAAQDERAIMWRILATQSELERACGDEAAASRLRAQARALVTDILEHAGELRATFLAQPAVAELLRKP